jgi:transposase
MSETPPTARELLDEHWPCDAQNEACLLAARVEAVLTELPKWRDGYCGDLAERIDRILDGSSSAVGECLCSVGWRHCAIHQDDGRE